MILCLSGEGGDREDVDEEVDGGVLGGALVGRCAEWRERTYYRGGNRVSDSRGNAGRIGIPVRMEEASKRPALEAVEDPGGYRLKKND